MKALGYIYKTTNLTNGRIYIGRRKGEFAPQYLGSGLIIQRAIEKEGKHNFKLEVIVYANDKARLDELEKQYIKEYRDKFGKRFLYNIADGGEGGNVFSNHPHIKEINMKKRLSSLGIKNHFYGKHHTEEAKEKNRLAHLGRHHTPEAKEKNRLSSLGRKLSPEARHKISLSQMGNITWRGRHHTEESKRKIGLSNSIALKGNIPWNKGLRRGGT